MPEKNFHGECFYCSLTFIVAQGFGQRAILDPSKMVLKSTLHTPAATADPAWPVDLTLNFNPYNVKKFVDIETADNMIVSGLKIKTSKAKWVKSFTIDFVKLGVVAPSTFETVKALRDSDVVS